MDKHGSDYIYMSYYVGLYWTKLVNLKWRSDNYALHNNFMPFVYLIYSDLYYTVTELLRSTLKSIRDVGLQAIEKDQWSNHISELRNYNVMHYTLWQCMKS